jgi:hypothetical protein
MSGFTFILPFRFPRLVDSAIAGLEEAKDPRREELLRLIQTIYNQCTVTPCGSIGPWSYDFCACALSFAVALWRLCRELQISCSNQLGYVGAENVKTLQELQR